MEFQGGPSVYTVVNAALRSEDRTKVAPFNFYLRLLLAGLAKLPKRSTTLHRGVVADLGPAYSKMKGETVRVGVGGRG